MQNKVRLLYFAVLIGYNVIAFEEHKNMKLNSRIHARQPLEVSGHIAYVSCNRRSGSFCVMDVDRPAACPFAFSCRIHIVSKSLLVQRRPHANYGGM